MLNSKPLSVMLEDIRDERSAGVPFPPGETRFSVARTRRFAEDPLPMLLDAYERFGPIFTMRLFHSNVVFMLGPAANHYITVSHASNFTWRESHFRDLIGLMGDGLLTMDEVLGLKLNADWVVLSACNTASPDAPAAEVEGQYQLRRPTDGRGLTGFRRARHCHRWS